VLDAHKDLHWAVAQIPVPEAGQSAQPPIGGTVMTLPRTGHTDRQRTAAKILDCLNEQRNQIDWGESVNNVPTMRAAAEQYKKQNPKLAAFADEVATARSRTTRVGASWPVVSDALSGAFQSVLTGKSSPAAALKQAQSRATSGK
ncbi:ABC transporter substrate-binding protein, partial [Streptomyces sp. SID11233]|nr:ABC transporter substrate-binding protein [Streptomyces sp. SID11233]